MKPSIAGAAVFSGLAAVVAADALPMDSIPLQCVKVCGPIVELTDTCNTNVDSRRRALKRRKDDGTVKMRSNPNAQHHGRRSPCTRGQCGKKSDEKRQFSVIRQAPTSFPPEVLQPPEETAAVAQPSRIRPVIVETTAALPTSANPPPPPTDQTNANDDDVDDDADDADEDLGTAPSTRTSSSSTTLSASTTGVSSEEPTATEAHAHAEEGDGDEEDDWWMPDDLEQQCVCTNKSFDVARLTALCASCVDQSGDDTNSTLEPLCQNFTFSRKNVLIELLQISASSWQRADSPTRRTLASWIAWQTACASRRQSRF